MLQGDILITGGAGALGRNFIQRVLKEKWDCKITIYSTDVMKHHRVKRMFPGVHSITGDIRDINTLSNAMVGKDYVLHFAARKHIPEAEWDSIDCYEVNVGGSLNVCMAALELGVPHVLGVSTDKACHPANAYGATKMLNEKVFQEYSRLKSDTNYHLVRFGNILESTGSVIQVWKEAIARGEPIKITDPSMTRFWLSPQQAVDMVLNALDCASGNILIPKMKKLSIGKLASHILGDNLDHVIVPLRPGEKIAETLLTVDECSHAFDYGDHFLLHPTTSDVMPYHLVNQSYTSEHAPELTKEELLSLLEND